MTFGFARGFEKRLAKVPSHIQRRAIKSLELLEVDPRHPSLHFKEVSSAEGAWSVRVSRSYRMVGYRLDEHVEWFWIGPHDQYDKLLSRL